MKLKDELSQDFCSEYNTSYSKKLSSSQNILIFRKTLSKMLIPTLEYYKESLKFWVATIFVLTLQFFFAANICWRLWACFCIKTHA